jgi:hypothetical protein
LSCFLGVDGSGNKLCRDIIGLAVEKTILSSSSLWEYRRLGEDSRFNLRRDLVSLSIDASVSADVVEQESEGESTSFFFPS